jgi:hypothetical protein
MWKSMNGALTAILLHMILLPTGLHAQTDEPADEPASDASLAICDEEASGEEGVYPCDRFLYANIEDDADTVKWLLEQIKSREDHSMQTSNTLYARDQMIQWSLVVLALILTVATAITKAYPKLKVGSIDFAMIPIALAALSAAVTSLSVYYEFDEYRRLNQAAAYDLAELKSDINFAVFRHAASQGRAETRKIDEHAINEWHERFNTIMQRYLAREGGNAG